MWTMSYGRCDLKYLSEDVCRCQSNLRYQRHDNLKVASDEIMRRKDELGALLAREEGKTR